MHRTIFDPAIRLQGQGDWKEDRILQIVQTLYTFGSGILAGVLLLSATGLRPAAAVLDPGQQMLLRQHLIQRLRILMAPFMLLPVIASGIALLLRTSGNWVAEAAGFVFSFSTIVVTVFINVPLNWRFASWSLTNLPADWQTQVRRWDRANSIRFILALAAFACALLSGGK